ncbi:MAG: hypothetical protein NZZ41_08060, partial [Candidatus Dojkabacteria bacterium]|nr:hypothetical protein [Candidatus Dojkabacteria bacterium]
KKSEFSYKKNNLFSRKDCCFQIFSYEMTIFNGEVKILLDKSVKRIFLYVSDHNSDNNPICIEDRY